MALGLGFGLQGSGEGVPAIPIFVSTGQSNTIHIARNYAPYSTTDLAYPFYYTANGTNGVGGVAGTVSKPGTVTDHVQSGTAIGSIWEFARELDSSNYRAAYSGAERFLFAMTGLGGTPAWEWNTGARYTEVVNIVDELIADYPGAYLHSVIINQGERDTQTPGGGWDTQWSSFITKIRAEFGDSVDFYVQSITSTAGNQVLGAQQDLIYAEQFNVAEGSGDSAERERTYVFDSDEFGNSDYQSFWMRDAGTHWSDVAMGQLGKAVWDIWKQNNLGYSYPIDGFTGEMTAVTLTERAGNNVSGAIAEFYRGGDNATRSFTHYEIQGGVVDVWANDTGGDGTYYWKTLYNQGVGGSAYDMVTYTDETTAPRADDGAGDFIRLTNGKICLKHLGTTASMMKIRTPQTDTDQHNFYSVQELDDSTNNQTFLSGYSDTSIGGWVQLWTTGSGNFYQGMNAEILMTNLGVGLEERAFNSSSTHRTTHLSKTFSFYYRTTDFQAGSPNVWYGVGTRSSAGWQVRYASKHCGIIMQVVTADTVGNTEASENDALLRELYELS